MAETQVEGIKRVDLRKYPNRRYYDTTRSKHVTLEEIFALIRAGSDVHITDSKTGEDITAKVLAQIILEQDSPKLDVFPVQLLHQLIRANEPLVRDFVDKYFNQALQAFLESQRQFDRYLRQALGLPVPLPSQREWARIMMGPFARVFFPNGGENGAGKATEPVSAPHADTNLERQLQELKQQLAALQQTIDRQQKVES